MDFYITDRAFKLQTIASTDGNTEFKAVQATDTITLETSSRRMTLGLTFTPETTQRIKDLVKVGYYVLYKDTNNKFVWMTILKVTHNPLTGIRTLELEDASLDLLNETVGEFEAKTAQPIKWYLEKFTWDSGFTIGVNEIPKLKRKLSWESTTTALERIQSVATQFDNAELEFSFKFTGNQLVSRKIDIYKKRGRNTEYKLYTNKDINSIETTEDIYQLVNSIYPTGGTVEGTDTPINLKGYNYTDPTGRFVVDKSNGRVNDTQNIKQWSRTNTNSHYFLQHKQWTTTNKKELVETTINYLKQYSQPVVSYTVDIANIPFGIVVGDTISIVDENEELFLSSRVQQLVYDYTSGGLECTLSDFVRIESGLSKQLQDMANQFKDDIIANTPYTLTIVPSSPMFINGKTPDDGTTITLSVTVIRGNTDITSTLPDLSFKWTRYKADGTLDNGFSKTGKQIIVDSGTETMYTYDVTLNTTEED